MHIYTQEERSLFDRLIGDRRVTEGCGDRRWRAMTQEWSQHADVDRVFYKVSEVSHNRPRDTTSA